MARWRDTGYGDDRLFASRAKRLLIGHNAKERAEHSLQAPLPVRGIAAECSDVVWVVAHAATENRDGIGSPLDGERIDRPRFVVNRHGTRLCASVGKDDETVG
jgi:hypothetical protein